ncbi:MAG: fasciclin [Bdellovibrio sp. ArHS]|uniref:fasciclin domain-containing protein n=1 Tax=Bdellovibrio sp. ArHS TaxID=1569284 RepID=UPI0005834EB7|nr:fasciclin domain-containing protein [Bdellovibrio sp. ArHS]KHD89601.1 MAG: fasciclin [Bdellovibrio sp. ArHS]
MKKIVGLMVIAVALNSCTNKADVSSEGTAAAPVPGQAAVVDDVSQKNVVQIAVGSKDHTVLVKALQAAELVDVLANPGPFTVFAPVNSAFDKLPAGTVEGLLKADKKEALADILQHHVFVGILKEADLTDGRVLNQVDLTDVTIHRKDGKLYVDDALIVASVPAANGIIHIIDGVLLPKKK